VRAAEGRSTAFRALIVLIEDADFALDEQKKTRALSGSALGDWLPAIQR
jgi:hypothetical protein